MIQELKEYLKIFFIVIIAIIIFIVLVIGIVMLFMKVNDYCAYSLIYELKGVPLPEKTVMIDSTYAAGKLIGSGNGMQYLGAMLIESKLSYDELKNYYNKYGKNKLYIFKKDDVEYTFNRNGDNLTFEKYDNNSNYYIVYKWGEGIAFFEFFDIRGH